MSAWNSAWCKYMYVFSRVKYLSECLSNNYNVCVNVSNVQAESLTKTVYKYTYIWVVYGYIDYK